MRLHFESTEDLRRYIAEQVLTSTDVMEILNVSRQRLNDMLKQGKFEPFKSQKATKLFFREDIERALPDLEYNRKKHGLGPRKAPRRNGDQHN